MLYGHIQAAGAVVGRVNGVPPGFEEIPHIGAEIEIVFDYEDVHRRFGGVARRCYGVVNCSLAACIALYDHVSDFDTYRVISVPMASSSCNAKGLTR